MPEKIKIAFVLPTLDKGGAERLTVDLILNLDREKFSPLLILFKRGGEWLSQLTAENIPVIILEKKFRFDLKNFWKLFSALRDFKPAIVHTHLGGDFYGRLAAKILGVAVIISTEHNINRDEGWFSNRLKRLTNGYADKIIAVSEAVRADIVKRYKTPASKISVIYNGLETANFLAFKKDGLNNETANSSRTVVFGTLGRLMPQKGQNVLIKALESLKNLDFKCLIGGEGRLAPDLQKQIDQAGLGAKVTLAGPISNPPAFLNSLDFFVLPSLWEGLGIVILEAGLIGLPIIASAIDGLTELISEETGWLVPAGDATVLATQISWLMNNLNDPEVIKRRGNLQTKILSDFNIKRISAAYQEIYQELLAKSEK